MKDENYPEAQSAFEKSLEIANLLVRLIQNLLRHLFNPAEKKCTNGHLDEALKLAERACDLVKKRLSPDLSWRKNLSIYFDLGQYVALKEKILAQKIFLRSRRKNFAGRLDFRQAFPAIMRKPARIWRS